MVTKRNSSGQILTVTPRGLFVDGKPTKTYNGEEIAKADEFAKALGKDFYMMQIMQSDLKGEHGKAGNPNPDSMGLYTWVRVRTKKDGTWSDWIRDVESDGFPTVRTDMFQSTQDEMRKLMMEKILSNTFKMHNPKGADQGMLRQALLDSLKGWKSESELVQYLDSGALGADSEEKSIEVFHKALKAFAAGHPDAVKLADDTGTYSLKMTNIVFFSKLSKLRLVYPVKPDNWLTADELSKHYIKAKPDVIKTKLNDLYIDMANGLSDDLALDDFDDESAEIINGGFDQVAVGNIEQWTNPHTGEPELCLKLTAIPEFCDKAKLKYVGIKDKNWKNAEELARIYIKATPTAIYEAMEHLSSRMKKDIQTLVNLDTGKRDLCLNALAIYEFCKQSGLSPRSGKDDPDWGSDAGKTKNPKKSTATKTGSKKAESMKKGKTNVASLKESRLKEFLGIFRGDDEHQK